MRVLVAEDEVLMADALAVGLRQLSMAVDVCYDGAAALERIGVNAYDVVVLDRDLPEVHGDQVCREILARGGVTRVLMLTAAAGVRDRVDGLGLGGTTTSPSPSPSTNWPPGCRRWPGGPGRRFPRCWSGRASCWTCHVTRPAGTDGSSPCRPRSSPCCTC